MEINISREFCVTPGGRYIVDGAHSGELFRTELLRPKYLEALKNKEKLTINLDGCYGFPTSFLDESFGGLARELQSNYIMDNIILICIDEPSIIDEIKKIVEIGGNII